MSKIDFVKLKETVSILQAASLVELKLTQHGDAYRSPCPACQSGGERAIVITPAKKAYYCFAEKKGGDVIALVAHVRGIGQRAAAEWLLGQCRPAESFPQRGNATDRQRKPKSSAALRLIQTDQLKPANENVSEHDPTDYTDLL